MKSLQEYINQTTINEAFSSDMLKVLGKSDLRLIATILGNVGISDVNIQKTEFKTRLPKEYTYNGEFTYTWPGINIIVDKTSKTVYLFDSKRAGSAQRDWGLKNFRWKLDSTDTTQMTEAQFYNFVNTALKKEHDLAVFSAMPIRDRGDIRSERMQNKALPSETSIQQRLVLSKVENRLSQFVLAKNAKKENQYGAKETMQRVLENTKQYMINEIKNLPTEIKTWRGAKDFLNASDPMILNVRKITDCLNNYYKALEQLSNYSWDPEYQPDWEKPLNEIINSQLKKQVDELKSYKVWK